MSDGGLTQFRWFTGSLQAGSNTIAVTFQARINLGGKVRFHFDAIPGTEQSRFILDAWEGIGPRPGYFSLTGIAADGTQFSTQTLHFTSLNLESDNEGRSTIAWSAACSRAAFTRTLPHPEPNPRLRMLLKGFTNFGLLRADCPLGTVVMDGTTALPEGDLISGLVEAQSTQPLPDAAAWRADADKLLEHIRRVMSFAAAAVLRAPVIEFYAGDRLEVTVLSQSRHAANAARTFHHLHQQPIFDAAVNSHFNPPVAVSNLFFAIEWFAMDATYNEMRLINAMTALENLVASNLEAKDALFLPVNQFEKTRRVLRAVIAKCLEKWPTGQGADALMELNERLNDLNRRSLLQRLKTLATRWSVPFDGLDDDMIKTAKQARDRIVHRGKYYSEGEPRSDDLWRHVTVVRELVVRFILTAIDFRGRYISHIGRYHDSDFPPIPSATIEPAATRAEMPAPSHPGAQSR